jgi:Pentapeptide repeats (8 copies)
LGTCRLWPQFCADRRVARFERFFFYWCYGKVLAPLMPKAGTLADNLEQAVWMVTLGNAVPFVGPLTSGTEIKKFLFCPRFDPLQAKRFSGNLMADAEDQSQKYDQDFFLALALKGKDAWNAWRRDPANKDLRVTFAGIDFSEAPKDQVDFSGFEFGDGADFSGCKWRWGVEAVDDTTFVAGRAFFAGAAFGHDATFAGAAFQSHANFTGAAFGHAQFTRADFHNHANFTRVTWLLC